MADVAVVAAGAVAAAAATAAAELATPVTAENAVPIVPANSRPAVRIDADKVRPNCSSYSSSSSSVSMFASLHFPAASLPSVSLFGTRRARRPAICVSPKPRLPTAYRAAASPPCAACAVRPALRAQSRRKLRVSVVAVRPRTARPGNRSAVGTGARSGAEQPGKELCDEAVFVRGAASLRAPHAT